MRLEDVAQAQHDECITSSPHALASRKPRPNDSSFPSSFHIPPHSLYSPRQLPIQPLLQLIQHVSIHPGEPIDLERLDAPIERLRLAELLRDERLELDGAHGVACGELRSGRGVRSATPQK